MAKCEVVGHKQEVCGDNASYSVRHKDKSKDTSFFVCNNHIEAYKIEVFKGERNFVIKEL